MPNDGRSISPNVAYLNILVHDVINLLYYLRWGSLWEELTGPLRVKGMIKCLFLFSLFSPYVEIENVHVSLFQEFL